jgi:hypothetical protein
MEAEVQFSGATDHRRDARRSAHHSGEVDAMGAKNLPAAVTDLSPSGCRIVIDQPLAADSVIWLKIGGHGPFMARVVWHDGTAAGCEFAGKLHPDLVAQLSEG